MVIESHGAGKDLSAATTLTTNTLLVQVGRFLDDPSAQFFEPGAVNQANLSVGGLFDFCNLVEAVVLHKELATIAGDVDDKSAKFIDHPLLTALTAAGVLRVGAIRLNISQAKADVTALLGELKLSKPLITKRGVALDWGELLPELFEAGNRVVPTYAVSNHWQFMQAIYHPSSQVILHGVSDPVEFLRGDQFASFITGTGEAERASHVLRSYLYYSNATAGRTAFVPDYPRIPYVSGINEQLRRLTTSVVERSQKLVHEELAGDIDQLLAVERPLGVPLPSFSAILLSRVSSVDDIPMKLLELREEYKSLRSSLYEFNLGLISAKTIGEVGDARKRIDQAFRAVDSKMHQKTTILDRLTSISEVASQGLKLSANPLSASASVLARPVEWLRGWWYRRPLAQLFSVLDELRQIKRYNELARNIFGLELDPRSVREFRRTQYALQNMFSGEQDMRGAGDG
jgi:hypothetical protein